MKQGIVVVLEWRVLHINFGLTFRAKIAIIPIGSLSSMIFRFSTPRPHGIQAAPNAVRRHGTNFRAKPRQYLTILEQGGSLIWLLSLIVPVYYDVYGKEVMHYSMLIQGHLVMTHSSLLILTSIGIPTLLPSRSCSDLIKSCSIMWTRPMW